MRATQDSFEKRQNEFRARKLQERRNVPVYNAHLNGALIDFHNHISKDEHYLVTNCGICRKYLSAEAGAGDEVT